MPSFIVALFLAVHGLIHASFLSPAPAPTPGAPAWPFDLARSWLLTPIGMDPSITRVIGIGLLVVVMAAYAVAALGVAGILPGSLFVPAVVAGCAASIVMLALFFHPWLVLGFVIDAALLWATLANGWRPGGAL